MPHISICIPAYQAERFLRETLESVRTQTFTDWEIIVTEDGSRDRTEEIINEFAKTVTQPVRYTRHDPNQGLPATRNAGIALAKAEWIALLDADDLWKPEHLENLWSCAQKTQADIIHSASLLFDSATGGEIQIRAPNEEMLADFQPSMFRGEYIVQPSSVLMRQALWQKVSGFDPSFRYVEDREMWIRCIRAGGTFAYNGKTTCRYRKHPGALSYSGLDMALANAQVFDKNMDWNVVALKVRKQLSAQAWYAYGRIAWRANPSGAVSAFARSLHYQPLVPATLFYWLLARIWDFVK
jgi:glycosyltransferase involved in cell wall biosynthesis